LLSDDDKRKVVVKKSYNRLVATHLKGIVASLVRKGKSNKEVKSMVVSGASEDMLIEVLKQQIWQGVKVRMFNDFEEPELGADDVAFEYWLNAVTSDDAYLDYSISSLSDDIVADLEKRKMITRKEGNND